MNIMLEPSCPDPHSSGPGRRVAARSHRPTPQARCEQRQQSARPDLGLIRTWVRRLDRRADRAENGPRLRGCGHDVANGAV